MSTMPKTAHTVNDVRRHRPSRRTFLLGAGTLVTLGLTGCGQAGSEGTGGDTRTVEHKYGSTKVAGQPSRVVTVGLTEQDYVLALGLAPVGTREWFGNHPGALWPWARQVLGENPLPKVLPLAELDFEQIAALEPDLILGVNSGLTRQEYDMLSKLAPTVAQPGNYADYGAPWHEITRVVGHALGRADQAAKLIASVEKRFGRARSQHPEFVGASGLLATSIEGEAYVYAEGPAPGFLRQLGFTLPPAADRLFTGKNREPVQLSPERLDALEADVLLLGLYGSQAPTVAEQPLYRRLRVSREGRDLRMPEMSLVNGALSFGTVLSLPTALDELVPRLTAMMDGDPASEPEPVTA